MNLATFAVLICLTGTEVCYGPYPSGSIHEVESLSIDMRTRQHNAYGACTSAANKLVEELDVVLKPYGLEAFVFEPKEGCKPPGADPSWRGKSTLNWGYGA